MNNPITSNTTREDALRAIKVLRNIMQERFARGSSIRELQPILETIDKAQCELCCHRFDLVISLCEARTKTSKE